MSVTVPPKGTRGVPFPRLADEAPEYPKYHDKTDRENPVLRLQRRQGEPRIG